MATASSHNSLKNNKNNLELYLNDVFEKECEFKIDQDEIDFIQTGIETLVKTIVDRVVEDVCKRLSRYVSSITKYSSNCTILKAYFPIPDDSSLHIYKTDDVDKIPTEKCSIICVGSFYDGTKNSFPDEFDFIVPLFDIKRFKFPLIRNLFSLHVPSFDAFEKITDILKFPPHCEGNQVYRQLTYDEYLELHGPAYKVQFKYDNGFGKTRFIHVDIVPALRAIDINRQQGFVNIINSDVKAKTFRESVLPLRSCLLVDRRLAYTEVEKEFMTSILSKKHVKVYRILKYLLNGHGDNENVPKREDFYCSYRIKIFMIYHHDDCEHADCEDLAPCVLQVLEEINIYKNTKDFPSLVDPDYAFQTTIPDTLLSCLKSLIADLHDMQTSVDSYDYDKNKRKSVTRQYLDSKPTYNFNKFIRIRRAME